jgi:hypothetical protein
MAGLTMMLLQKSLSVLLMLGLCVAGVALYGHTRYEAGRAYEQSLATKQEVKDEKTNRGQEAVVTKAKDQNYDQYIKDRDAARADAAVAHDELGRLRNVVADFKRRASQSAPAQCGTDGAAQVAELLERCSERHQAVARDASDLAEQVIGLQGYIHSISPICIRQGD